MGPRRDSPKQVVSEPMVRGSMTAPCVESLPSSVARWRVPLAANGGARWIASADGRTMGDTDVVEGLTLEGEIVGIKCWSQVPHQRSQGERESL